MVLTHFPCCVALLGIPRHIVLVPNELQQVLSGSFGCFSHTAGAYIPAVASHCEVSVERLGLIPNADLVWTLGSPSISGPSYQGMKNILVPLHTHQGHRELECRHKSICLDTSQPFQNYLWNGTIVP